MHRTELRIPFYAESVFMVDGGRADAGRLSYWSLSESTMENTARPKNLTPTLVGLAIALFASPVFIAIYRTITGENHSDRQVLGREFLIFLLVGLLLWIVKRLEFLPLTSIGLRVNMLRTSLLRGLWLAVIILAVTVGLYLLLREVGVHLGEDRSNEFHPSLLVVTVIMLRAGVAEEVFYRGFAIERLQSLTGSTLLAGLVPLAIFAAAHYRQGLGGIVAAFVLGGIFTAFYMKFRDLLANITAHFIGDFVLNVVLPIASRG
jgi:membrane protease YdiL (CAAX protease family)